MGREVFGIGRGCWVEGMVWFTDAEMRQGFGLGKIDACIHRWILWIKLGLDLETRCLDVLLACLLLYYTR